LVSLELSDSGIPQIDRRKSMNTNSYLDEPEELTIEFSLLLEFLIKRFNEVLASDSPRVPAILQGLAAAALSVDDESLANFKGLMASPHLPPREIIRRAIEILQLVLESGQSSFDFSRLDCNRDREPDERSRRCIIRNAFREGRIMLEQSDYKYVQVFVILAWGGLEIDPERLAEFETVRTTFKEDPKKLVQEGTQILRDAIFQQTPSGRIHPASN